MCITSPAFFLPRELFYKRNISKLFPSVQYSLNTLETGRTRIVVKQLDGLGVSQRPLVSQLPACLGEATWYYTETRYIFLKSQTQPQIWSPIFSHKFRWTQRGLGWYYEVSFLHFGCTVCLAFLRLPPCPFRRGCEVQWDSSLGARRRYNVPVSQLFSRRAAEKPIYRGGLLAAPQPWRSCNDQWLASRRLLRCWTSRLADWAVGNQCFRHGDPFRPRQAPDQGPDRWSVDESPRQPWPVCPKPLRAWDLPTRRALGDTRRELGLEFLLHRKV